MADVQKHFIEFHDAIKLSYDDNAVLRDKRDIVLSDLKRGLRRMFPPPQKSPVFKYFNQGSYALGTGIVPLDGDYDIDVGIVFQLNSSEFSPTRVKSWIHDALSTRNRTVYFMRPCIRVQYHQNEYEAFHIDLAVYTREDNILTSKPAFYISKGLPNSNRENVLWEAAQPFELLNLIRKRFNDIEDAKQFRRVIRYLKRWNDLNFYSGGHAKPRGIAITALAYRLFRPVKNYDWSTGKNCPNDLHATRNFVSSIINSFGFFNGRIAVKLPVQPYNDIFAKMTDKQMADFKQRLLALKSSLDSAIRKRSVEDACDILCEEFGDDFPTLD